MIEALGNFIIIKTDKKDTTPSGLYVPNVNKAVHCTGKVFAVGDEVKDIKADDEVIYRPYAAAELMIDRVEYLVLERADVIGLVK